MEPAHRKAHLSLDDVRAIVPNVRAFVEKSYYVDDFNRLSPRERLFCKVLADLGPGAHPLRAVSDRFGVPSSALGSLRGNLIKKGIAFAPAPGTITFRMPLADRYVREHQDVMYDRAVRDYERTLTAKERVVTE